MSLGGTIWSLVGGLLIGLLTVAMDTLSGIGPPATRGRDDDLRGPLWLVGFPLGLDSRSDLANYLLRRRHEARLS